MCFLSSDDETESPSFSIPAHFPFLTPWRAFLFIGCGSLWCMLSAWGCSGLWKALPAPGGCLLFSAGRGDETHPGHRGLVGWVHSVLCAQGFRAQNWAAATLTSAPVGGPQVPPAESSPLPSVLQEACSKLMGSKLDFTHN